MGKLDEHTFDGSADIGFTGPAGEPACCLLVGFLVADRVFDLLAVGAGQIGHQFAIVLSRRHLDVVKSGAVASVRNSANSDNITRIQPNTTNQIPR